MIKSMIFPTWDPNTSLSFLTSILRMSTEMKKKEAIYSRDRRDITALATQVNKCTAVM